MTDENYARLELLRTKWDSARLFVGYLAADNVELNRNPT